jgi:hypothetical protein
MILFILVCLAAIVIKWCESTDSFWVLAWPGTVAHELLHAVVGFLFLAQPCNFSILPRDTEQGRELGSVGFSNLTWYNKLPIAVAPLLSIPLVFYASTTLTFSTTVAGFATVWILASILAQALPSKTDWQVGLSSPMGVAAWAGVAYLLIR